MSMLRQCGALMIRQMIDQQQQQAIIKRNIYRYGGVSTTTVKGKEKFHKPSQIYLNQIRGHKNFGHETEKTPRVTKLFHLIIGSIFFVTITDWRKVKEWFTPRVDAYSNVNDDGDNRKYKEKSSKKSSEKIKENKLHDNNNDNNDQEQEQDLSEGDDKLKTNTKSKKEKIGFRERKIIEYENRIRQFSTPDKVFRYFATIQAPTSDDRHEIYMTPVDFLTSMTPGMKHPEGLGLDQYKRYDPKSLAEDLNLKLEKDSIFYKLGSYGLITFSDYIFLLTVLSTSRRHFEIAFQMFDLNGDGDVDSDEFQRVENLARLQSSIGRSHRDHANTGSTFKGINSALITYFFGPNLDQKLTITKFLEFQEQLQREILSLEFERKNPNDDGKISEVAFAELLLAYAGLNTKIKQRKLKRVKKIFRHNSQGIAKKDYLNFFHFINHITDVDTALTFYNIAGASIDQATLKHVAKTVAKVELSDHIINVIFAIFDDNDDNQLSNREFIAVMKNRVQRGLEKPKDTGFLKLIQSILKCAQETKPVLLDL